MARKKEVKIVVPPIYASFEYEDKKLGKVSFYESNGQFYLMTTLGKNGYSSMQITPEQAIFLRDGITAVLDKMGEEYNK
jgi:hypothetical protein